MSRSTKNFIIWIALSFIIYALYTSFSPKEDKTETLNTFYQYLDAGEIQQATVTLTAVGIKTTDGKVHVIPVTPYYTTEIIERLMDSNVETKINLQEGSPIGRLLLGLLGWLPTILFIGFWIYLFKKTTNPGSKGSGGSPTKLFGFSKSKAKVILPQDINVKFDDVAGIDEAKAELAEIVDFLKDPKKYSRIGAKIPKGCLLFGSPGTGKTLLAKAIAGESGCPFFSVSGSDFVEMFVGVGASRVRELFSDAKEKAPCIVFIDEIDAVGRHRGSGVGGGNDEREQTLNQLLVEMDGFGDNSGVIVIAATNRPDVLDNALMRPGRFDRQITINKPDLIGREKVLAVHSKKAKLSPDVNLKSIARATPGFSGADLSNIVNEAALIAIKNNRRVVTTKDFELAKDKILMGLERGIVMKEDERMLTAYHEAGHAITALFCEGSDPIHKATIIPRGRALGVVMRYPEEDRLSYTRQKMLADLTVAMGGRAAEHLKFGYEMVTSGASSDIKQATGLARMMVKEWGMSDAVGAIFHGANEENPYQKELSSEEINKVVDNEVKRLVDEALANATKMLQDKNAEWELLSQTLLKYETLSGDEIRSIVLDGKIPEDVLQLDPDEDAEVEGGIWSVIETMKEKEDKSGDDNKDDSSDKEEADDNNDSDISDKEGS